MCGSQLLRTIGLCQIHQSTSDARNANASERSWRSDGAPYRGSGGVVSEAECARAYCCFVLSCGGMGY